MDRISFKTINEVGGTDVQDNSAQVLNENFTAGVEAAQAAEENKNSDLDLDDQKKEEEGKAFGETKVGAGMAKVGKFFSKFPAFRIFAKKK